MRNWRVIVLTTSIVVLLLVCVVPPACFGQRGTIPSRVSGFTLFGDMQVSGKGSEGRSLIFDVLLYSRSGVLVDRQKVGNKGRYRFLNVPAGDYDIVIEFETAEVARTQIRLIGIPTDFRNDLALEWKSGSGNGNSGKPTTISAEDAYARTPTNTNRFEKGQEAFTKKDYEHAITYFRQIVDEDSGDFQAWSELGTVYLAQKNFAEAENSYLKAIEVRPKFFLALLNLGKVRLMLKNFEGAISVLEQAVSVQAKSADANYFLGECYLQIKKGSKAVGYLYEALKLDPIGMSEVHLRLASLYNGAGLKDKAAAEYEEFLKKKPDYPERKQLEKYIAENRKKS